MSSLSTPLTLPCGATLPNRIAKAAMTEGLADPEGRSTAELERLYRIWGTSGAGLLISGNIHIDAQHLERPGNIIIDDQADPALTQSLRDLVAVARGQGAAFWAQISHAGRQTSKAVNPAPKAPSAVALNLPGGQFGRPVALTEREIASIIDRFVAAAKQCEVAGFSGVQIHAAHGYLLSQFLSPLTNKRQDQWGGTLENRARALIEIVRRVVGQRQTGFAVAVKLNSADFQRGGFAFEESLQVAQWLQAAGVDCIEISGGTYEQPRLLGVDGVEPADEQPVAASTIAREAYFVDFAQAMRRVVTVPLMVTGGLRTRKAMEQVVDTGAADLIGVARPLCYAPDAISALLDGAERLPEPPRSLALFPRPLRWLRTTRLGKALDTFAAQYWYYVQIYALGKTGTPAPGASPLSSFLAVERAHKAWLSARRDILSKR